jgi:phosphoribosylformimino-5-aminoimidazole carboxamide ribotide isomerase
MLIPSIDLMGGKVVQLERGERLMLETDDLEGWVERFADYPIVQVIDLDAALTRGDNDAIVRSLCARRACQVGGGVRTVARARALLDAGACRVIIGSALYTAQGVNREAASGFSDALGHDAFAAAIDARAGRVAIHGWKTLLPLTPGDAARALNPFAGNFLYTHIETEGTMSGLDLTPIRALREVTSRRLIVAGGIRDRAEVDTLDALGIDAVVGMAIYTGRFGITKANVKT